VQLDSRDEALAVKLAKVRLAEAERAYNRYLRSEKRGAVTRATIDDARSAVEAARIELDRAKVALDDRTLEAPFDGIVGITDIDRGARVSPDTPITSLDDRSVLIVSFEVPESLSGRLKRGDAVSVAPWSGRGGTIQGRIVDIDSRIDPLSRTFVARAHVNNEDDRLRPGMSFRITLELEGEDYPVVPEVSVQWGGEGSFVWSVADDTGKVRRVPVTIVQRLGSHVLVDAPLAAGSLVVVAGVQRMREGREVSQFDPKILAGDGAAGVDAPREKPL
jgi:RND family efflux transporter MFP subunit